MCFKRIVLLVVAAPLAQLTGQRSPCIVRVQIYGFFLKRQKKSLKMFVATPFFLFYFAISAAFSTFAAKSQISKS